MNKGIIPCLSDAKLKGAASELAARGFSGICTWHTVGRAGDRGGTVSLVVFDPESETKWQVKTKAH